MISRYGIDSRGSTVRDCSTRGAVRRKRVRLETLMLISALHYAAIFNIVHPMTPSQRFDWLHHACCMYCCIASSPRTSSGPVQVSVLVLL